MSTFPETSSGGGRTRGATFGSPLLTLVGGLIYWAGSEVFGGPRQHWAGAGWIAAGLYRLLDTFADRMLQRQQPIARRGSRAALLIAFVIALWLILRQVFAYPATRTGPLQ
jgi:hypothetical protein